jgi:hypothetical protein
MDSDRVEVLLTLEDGRSASPNQSPLEQSGRRGCRTWLVVPALLLAGFVGWGIGRTAVDADGAPPPISTRANLSIGELPNTSSSEAGSAESQRIHEAVLDVPCPFSAQPVRLVPLYADGAVLCADLETDLISGPPQLDPAGMQSPSLVAGATWALVRTDVGAQSESRVGQFQRSVHGSGQDAGAVTVVARTTASIGGSNEVKVQM